MIELVEKRHPGDGWIIFSELANAPGVAVKRFADAVALGVWASTKYEAHLYEFKASRSDLKKEITDPAKMEAVGKYCHYRWLAVTDEKIIEGLAIPDAWGIVTPTVRGGHRVFKVVRKAPRLKAVPFSATFAVACIRNIRSGYPDPAKHRALELELEQLKHGPPPTEEEIAEGRTKFDLERKLAALEKKVQAFQEASGVDLGADWQWGRVGAAVKFALDHRDMLEDGTAIRRAVHDLGHAASRLEEAAAEAARKAVELRELAGGPIAHSEHCSAAKWSAIVCRCGANPLSTIEAKLMAERALAKQDDSVASSDPH